MNKALTDSLSAVKDAFVLVKAKIDPDVDTETNCCLMDVLEMLLDARDHIKNAAPDAPTSEAAKNNTPCILYDNPDDMSSEFHVGKIVHTPDGDGKVVDYKDGFVLTWLLNKRGWHSYAESDLTPF